MDWAFAPLERCNFVLIVIDQEDLMSQLGKTGARNKADITRTDYGDSHPLNPKSNEVCSQKRVAAH